MTHEHSQDRIGGPTLGRIDQEAVDALMNAGFDSSQISDEALRARAERVQSLLALLRDYPVSGAPAGLMGRTLERIEMEDRRQAERMQFAAHLEEGSGRGLRFRWADLITGAAVILIGAGILMPVLSNARARSMETACANNMRTVAQALQSYAADNNGALPMATAGMGRAWDMVANYLNLKPLVRGGYCEQSHLECPGHHEHGPSLSYQWQSGTRPVRLSQSEMAIAVVGDKNPLLDPARAGTHLAPLTVSVNHGGRGQNVLLSDFSTMWLEEPVMNAGDNIWLPNNADMLTPGMVPTLGDVFLAH